MNNNILFFFILIIIFIIKNKRREHFNEKKCNDCIEEKKNKSKKLFGTPNYIPFNYENSLRDCYNNGKCTINKICNSCVENKFYNINLEKGKRGFKPKGNNKCLRTWDCFQKYDICKKKIKWYNKASFKNCCVDCMDNKINNLKITGSKCERVAKCYENKYCDSGFKNKICKENASIKKKSTTDTVKTQRSLMNLKTKRDFNINKQRLRQYCRQAFGSGNLANRQMCENALSR